MLSWADSFIHPFAVGPAHRGRALTVWWAWGLPRWTECHLAPPGAQRVHGGVSTETTNAGARQHTEWTDLAAEPRLWIPELATAGRAQGPWGPAGRPWSTHIRAQAVYSSSQTPLQALTSPSPHCLWPRPRPAGQLCLTVLSNCPCVTGWVSDQALLFCPRTIQGAARPRRLDCRVAGRHCPGLPRGQT